MTKRDSAESQKPVDTARQRNHLQPARNQTLHDRIFGDPDPPPVRNLDRQEYERRRGDLAKQYGESIGRYDQLVPWGAGGALLASITFLEKIAPHPQALTRWMLLASWAALGLALAASTASHYASSRIFSWRVNQLDHRWQQEHAPDNDEWSKKWFRISRRVRRWGRITAVLNPIAGLSLVAGVALLALFAYRNAPFAQGP